MASKIFGCVFFVWKVCQTLIHARTAQLVSQQSLASIINKNKKINKKNGRLYPSLFPLARTLSIGVSGSTFGSTIQAIPPPSWGSAPR